MRTYHRRIVLIVLAALVATACGDARPTAVVDASGRPQVLRYLYSPSAEEPETQGLRLERLKAYLKRELNLDVELYKTSAGYGVAIEAMRARKVDMATFGPFGYLIASEKAGAEAILVRGDKTTGQGFYKGVIAVAKRSDIRSIDDLLGRSKALTFAFVDPASTSGYLVQYAFLQSRGVEPSTAFKKTMFSVNHIASAMAVVAGKVDASAIMENTIVQLASLGKIADDDLRVLWTSPPLPSSPIAVRRDLPEAFKQELQRAFLAIPERDPELWAMWPKVRGVENQVLLPGTDAMFDGLRAMARGVENLSLLEK